MTPRTAHTQIRRILTHLAKIGLSDDQETPIIRRSGLTEITFENAGLVSRAMKGIPYADVYGEFVRNRVFSAKLLDGALLQMAYAFDRNVLAKHRLVFLASPHLRRFDEDPARYLNDERYAHILDRDVDPVTIRFDYDDSDSRHREVQHPKSHLTIGGYEHCRVPVSSPLTPLDFVEFVLRSFYSTATDEFASDLPSSRAAFPRSISAKEEAVLRVVVPRRLRRVPGSAQNGFSFAD